MKAILKVFAVFLMFLPTGVLAATMTFSSATVGSNPPYTEAGMTVTTIDNKGWEPTFFNSFSYTGGVGLHMEGGIIIFDIGGPRFNLDELVYDVLHDANTSSVIFSNGSTYPFSGGQSVSLLSLDFTSVASAKNIHWFAINLPGEGL